jgi:integrase
MPGQLGLLDPPAETQTCLAFPPHQSTPDSFRPPRLTSVVPDLTSLKIPTGPDGDQSRKFFSEQYIEGQYRRSPDQLTWEPWAVKNDLRVPFFHKDAPMTSATVQDTRFKFSHKLLEALPAHDPDSPSREKEYSDTEVTGLRLVVSKNGRRFFDLRYRFNRRKRAIRIGEFPAVPLAAARIRANEFKNMISRGIDPVSERNKLSATLTFKDFTENHYLPHATETKKSWKDDRNKLKNELIPLWGKLQLSAITPRDIQNHINNVKRRASAVSGNRHYVLICRMFNLAIKWSMVEKNPCKLVEKFFENCSRDRHLDDQELLRLHSALEKCEKKSSVNAIKLLLYTGMRKSECLGLTWEHVDLEKGTAYLPETKNGTSRTVLLNDRAKAVLEDMKQYKSDHTKHVFPGRDGTARLTEVRKTFLRALKEAKIDNFHLHDLRHTFASILVNQGVPLYEVQRLLGHSDITLTQRYSHLADAQLRKATANVSERIDKVTG